MNVKGFALILTLVTLIGLSSASLAALLFYAQMIEAQQLHQWRQLSQQLELDFESQRTAYEQTQK
ncbi:Type II secretion pathway-like protein [Idiomarina sp. HP20-50]|uniref:Type II secretion pathway-like protein n=1 Tax=Idiomarina sp. HP20-50 TaxID=3070813 RepID=UPI00294B44A9|nr:Type II secretion pathway-like protein [Idiomarina sp. HP20-50]MDV6316952.1 Type II secretion pathway-like protein [Idiomarina sp. HP20-50]